MKKHAERPKRHVAAFELRQVYADCQIAINFCVTSSRKFFEDQNQEYITNKTGMTDVGKTVVK